MESNIINILNVTDEEKESVRKSFEKTEKDIQQDIQILRQWLQTQPHFPEQPSDRMIESYLLVSKFSVEKTKIHLDAYYTLRDLMPEYYRNVHPKSAHMKRHFDAFLYVPLPNLTEDYHRIIVLQYGEDPNEFHMNYVAATVINIKEICLNEEYSCGDLILVDCKNLKMGHFVKYTPMFLTKIRKVLENALGDPMKGIHIVNGPIFSDLIVQLAKNFVSPKLQNRIYAHPNLESLYEYMDRKLLPKDYGGDLPPFSVLKESYRAKVLSYSDRFDHLETLKIDETLRPEKLQNDEILGYYGNFKQLNVD